jgi:RimJ/RimL family protein N-acetyltransferase
MRLALSTCTVRAWSSDDLGALVRHANHRDIWMQVRDRFPHPYLEQHGRTFLDYVTQQSPPTVWAIEVDGEAAGGIGLELQQDVERVSAEIGYWLGRAHWGKGVMTEVLTTVTAEVFQRFDLLRIFALPFADNPASIRVLQKAGYVLEGRMPQSTIKDGRVRDQLMFGAYKALR